MKAITARAPLHEAFQLAMNVVPPRSTIPAVTHLKLTATAGSGKTPGHLELACTDLEFGLLITVSGAQVKEEGTVVLPAARMGAILRESEGEDVSLDSDGTLTHVHTSDASFKIVGLDPADFPAVPGFEEQGAIPIDTKDLSEMIRKTQFAVSSEVVRYALTGQLFEIHGKELRMVASDGKRLAFIKSRTAGRGGESRNLRVIVPTKTMNLLDRVLTDRDETVWIHLEETQVRLKTSRAMIFSRLIDGNFPDYEAVIPADRDKKITLNREALFAAVRKAALMTTDKSRAVRFTFAKGKLTLFTRTADVGEVTVETPTDYEGEEIELTFNPEYIADYLKVMTDPSVELHLKDRSSAAVFKAGKEYVYVLMPLTVSV
ncbi:MAG: DNA polymerase III subunit beta [Planctomycetes bacterium]|nr:DNA polymerase III subunit beta [Planctomycetota bacterium]